MNGQTPRSRHGAGRRSPDDRGGGTQRLFVAVPLPEDLLPLVRDAQAALPALPGLRLSRADQLHVTLAFIGQVDETKAQAARAVVTGLSQSLVAGAGMITGFLFLPSATKARVVTLAVRDDEGAFATLFESVMNGLEGAGVMKREKRPFRPHLTIARLRIPGPVRPKLDCDEAPFSIESVCLYKSELKRDGAIYSVLAGKNRRGTDE
ncbi:MAG: RNA 2',3'-cyclic phosphodiesterase [Thermoleophilia bacterium]